MSITYAYLECASASTSMPKTNIQDGLAYQQTVAMSDADFYKALAAGLLFEMDNDGFPPLGGSTSQRALVKPVEVLAAPSSTSSTTSTAVVSSVEAASSSMDSSNSLQDRADYYMAQSLKATNAEASEAAFQEALVFWGMIHNVKA